MCPRIIMFYKYVVENFFCNKMYNCLNVYIFVPQFARSNLQNSQIMEQIVLKKEILDKIQNEGALFGKVADAVGVKPVSLPRLLSLNDPRLTQAGVLKELRDHLGVEQDSELLEEIQIPENINA